MALLTHTMTKGKKYWTSDTKTSYLRNQNK